MSLRDRIRAAGVDRETGGSDIAARFGVIANPFPPSSQTTNNPHMKGPIDDEIEERIVSFVRDHKTQVVVVEGTQGTGKTNVLNHYEAEIGKLHSGGDLSGFYVIRYLADPEASFEGTIRRLFQELGVGHLDKLARALEGNETAIEQARMVDLRTALRKLARTATPVERAQTAESFLDWLLGMRLLKQHRLDLGVNFRLDTVEAKTAALRDIVLVSSAAGVLNGIFLLLDELEKQDGVLSPAAVVRYLSALRAIIDALPNHLFMMIAVTPDALRRYSTSLPAFRSRLQDRVELRPLTDADEAVALADFYVEQAKRAAREAGHRGNGDRQLLDEATVRRTFDELYDRARKAGDTGLRQRLFLHSLYQQAEKLIQAGGGEPG